MVDRGSAGATEAASEAVESARGAAATPRLSVIIPTFNEETTIATTLRTLSGLVPQPHEIFIVDGQSEDRTVEIAESLGARVYPGPRGRAHQLNRGAQLATGDLLCFLHADTWLPHDAVSVITQTMADRRISLGGFISLMRGPTRTRWITSFHNFLKTYYTAAIFAPIKFLRGGRLLFGDQALFCRRQDFLEIGGFAEIAIMEEAELCLRMWEKGRIRQINRICESSDRRVANWGELKANAIYLYIGFKWGFDLIARRFTGRRVVDVQALSDLYGEER